MSGPIGLLLPLVVATFAVSWILTRLVRDFALRAGQLDHPNARSSHVAPTPRGGGVSFVITTLAATISLAAVSAIPQPIAASILAGGLLVATVGVIDDRRGLSARIRLCAHLCATLAVVLLLDLWHAPLLATLGRTTRFAAVVAAVVGGAWLVNLTNFMDGIDGIAGAETVTASLGIALCAWAATSRLDDALIPIVLAAGAAGFLVWNWPPARIFMGDAGSGFLGFVFAAVTIAAAAKSTPVLMWCCVIMLAVFIVDATVTLLHRLLRRQRVTEGHRTHAYQQLARQFGSHRRVTMLVAVINACWLLPCALFAATGRLHGALATMLAYLPVVAGAVWAGSGAPERAPRRSRA